MSNTENTPIQINWKTKKDGMLINLRASSGPELDLLIDELSQRLAALVDLEATTESMARAAGATNTVQDSFPGAQVVNQGAVQRPAPQAAAPAAAPGTVPTCTGGACGGAPMRFVAAGISKSTGKPYRAFYACPLPQGQACSHKAQP
jgi:hypothetical protein